MLQIFTDFFPVRTGTVSGKASRLKQFRLLPGCCSLIIGLYVVFESFPVLSGTLDKIKLAAFVRLVVVPR